MKAVNAMRKLLWLVLVPALHAQISQPGVQYVTSAPSGACSGLPIQVISGTGVIWTCDNGTWAAATSGGGNGTVTSVSVTTANGVSGTVAASTTTPAITLTLGAITPTSVNSLVVGTGSSTGSGVALGISALGGSGGVSGADNVAVGFDALDTASGTLTNSTGVGAYAGLGAIGSNEVIVGYSAGLTGGSMGMTGANNTVLGANATISAQADTNEIVIGEAAAGQGSNTVVLGTASTVKNYLYGAVLLTGVQTTVSCSTSGTAVFSQPEQGTTWKRVVIHLAACLGTASYTYPTAFTNTPSVYASNNVAAGVASSVSASAVTVTGATSTGSLALEDY